MAGQILSWFFRQLIHRLGVYPLLVLALLLLGLGSVAWTLSEVLHGQGLDLLLPITLGGILLGWGLAAARPVPGWLACGLSSALGVELILLRVGRLGGAVLQTGRSLFELVRQTVRNPLDGPPDPWPALLALTGLGSGLSTQLSRLGVWLLGLVSGNPVFDLTAATLAWSLAMAAVATWAAWGVRRWENPLVAMAPAAALLATTLAYALRLELGLLPVVGATLLLLGLVNYRRRERDWERRGVDFALNIRTDLAAAVVFIALGLVALGGSAPSLSVRQIVRLVQDVFQVGSTLDSLGVRRPPVQSSLSRDLRAPGLPRRHLLGSGPELSEQVVLLITTADPATAPPPRYYWRSLTYDVYTGRGWLTSQTEVQDYAAGQPALTDLPAARRPVHQQIEVIGEGDGLLYAAGELVTANRPYTLLHRSHNDFFGATIAAGQYQVDSLVAATDEAGLRQAGAAYPSWLATRYLQLPADVPPRVLSLARDLTATAPTPYDQAKAIESYLRAWPYSLDLPAPPLEQDVVDYFLFDLQQGYCDYYASAMVVLARAAGLPARLAVGYLGHTYDPASGRYVISEAEAHSWVEIYFPGYGWITFEPTGGRPELARSDEPAAPVPELPSPAGRGAAVEVLRWGLGLAGGLALLPATALGWLAGDSWRLRHTTPAAAVTRLYRRLRRYGPRLEIPDRAGDTPYEFAAALTARLAGLAPTGRLAALLAPATPEVRRLTGLYVQTLFSPHPLTRAAQLEAIRTWQRLRRRFWIAWVYRLLKRAPAAGD
ncbi:MAG: transglutaminase domain-containing protein [Chloroflexota bacterium]